MGKLPINCFWMIVNVLFVLNAHVQLKILKLLLQGRGTRAQIFES